MEKEKGRGGWWGGILLNWKPWAKSIALVWLINKKDSLDSEFIKIKKKLIRETYTQNWWQKKFGTILIEEFISYIAQSIEKLTPQIEGSRFVYWGGSAKRANPVRVPKILPAICLDSPYGTNHKDSRGTINQPTLLTFTVFSAVYIYFFLLLSCTRKYGLYHSLKDLCSFAQTKNSLQVLTSKILGLESHRGAGWCRLQRGSSNHMNWMSPEPQEPGVEYAK